MSHVPRYVTLSHVVASRAAYCSHELIRRLGRSLEMWWRAACRWSLSSRICANSERMRTWCAQPLLPG